MPSIIDTTDAGSRFSNREERVPTAPALSR
jgi:hypothetical protein